jgi:hypothetical protein
MTGNTMAKIKWTKGQTRIYKTLPRTLKNEQHEHHKQTGCIQVLWLVSSSCSTSGPVVLH